MGSQVLILRGKSLHRAGSRSSFAGAGWLERMRSTTFALLGVTTAIGLGMIAIVSQQGFSPLPGLPLPGGPSERGRVHEAAPAVDAAQRGTPGRIGGSVPVSGSQNGDRQAPGGSSDLAGSQHLVHVSAPASGGRESGDAAVTEESAPAAMPVEPVAPSASPQVPEPASATATPAPVQAAPQAGTAAVSSTPPSANTQGNGNVRSKSPKSKPSNSPPAAPQAPPAAPAAPQTEATAAPSPEVISPGKVHGNGNAYGHSK
jgi:hypothetical protein